MAFLLRDYFSSEVLDAYNLPIIVNNTPTTLLNYIKRPGEFVGMTVVTTRFPGTEKYIAAALYQPTVRTTPLFEQVSRELGNRTTVHSSEKALVLKLSRLIINLHFCMFALANWFATRTTVAAEAAYVALHCPKPRDAYSVVIKQTLVTTPLVQTAVPAPIIQTQVFDMFPAVDFDGQKLVIQNLCRGLNSLTMLSHTVNSVIRS